MSHLTFTTLPPPDLETKPRKDVEENSNNDQKRCENKTATTPLQTNLTEQERLAYLHIDQRT